MYKLIAIVILTLVIVASLIMGGIFFYLKFIKSPGGETTSIATVEAIQKIAQLATVEYHISEFVHQKKRKEWYEWLEASFFVFVKGKVRGSVDLKQTSIDIDHENKIVTIKFKKGAIKVHDPEIPPKDGITLITCSDPNIFHKINDKDWENAQKAAIANLKKIAEDDQIKKKTAAEAKLVLRNFLQALDYDSHIEFEDKSLEAAVSGIFFANQRLRKLPVASVPDPYPYDNWRGGNRFRVALQENG